MKDTSYSVDDFSEAALILESKRLEIEPIKMAAKTKFRARTALNNAIHYCWIASFEAEEA